MRATFVETLVRLAADDDSTVLLTADLGFMALEPFAERFPRRFFNVGVSEQNMIGMATGLAEAGFRVYCYSIAPFAALRPFEFIRNGPVGHRLPVRVVGIGGGFEYGHAGTSHHGTEDVGALRTLAGLTIVSPADAAQARTAIEAVHALPGPVYLRIGKDERRVVQGLDGRFALGRLDVVRQGADVLLLVLGSIGPEVVAAAEQLSQAGVQCEVAVVASVAPAPVDDLLQVLARHRLALTVEAHSVVGGLGSLVAEVLAENPMPCRLARLGVSGQPPARTGSEGYLNAVHGLDRTGIVSRVQAELKAACR